MSAKKTKSNRDNRDNIDELDAKLAQLSSLMHIISGEGMATFDIYNDEIRANYLWACSALADDAMELSSKLTYQ